jgi:RNA polymerase sigma factor (TIGR02999 family)
MAEQDPLEQLVDAARRGDDAATDRLLPAVYQDLRSLARTRLARVPPGQTLQATALVHEAWLKLIGGPGPWENRAEFFAAAGRAMHNILVDRARRRGARKRDGQRETLDPNTLESPLSVPPESLLALDEALERLSHEDPRCHRLVQLKFFACLSHEEVAEALGVTVRTVERDWRWTKAWLLEALGKDPAP